MIKSILPLFLVLLHLNGLSQIAPKYVNEFLTLGAGARASSMGNSVVTSELSSFSGYWNPALLSGITEKNTVGYMHSDYFAGISKYDVIATSHKLTENLSGGFTYLRFGIDNIPNTLELYDSQGNIRYDRVQRFSAIDNAFIFSIAISNFRERISIGANVKIIRRTTGDFASSWGFGFDLAALAIFDEWKVGLMAKDITTTFNAWKFNESLFSSTYQSTGNELPESALELTRPSITAGISRYFILPKEMGLLSELNLQIFTDGKRNSLLSFNPLTIDPLLGFEYDYKKIVFVRSGLNSIQQTITIEGENKISVQPNVGLGIKFKKFELNYGLTKMSSIGTESYTHLVSLQLNFAELSNLK